MAGLGRRLPSGLPIGESWEVADLDESVTAVDDPFTRVLSGPEAGRRLADLIASDANSLLGSVRPVAGRFPLLVKTLDASENLSIQVHPTEGYAGRHSGAAAKTESWLVLDAAPGAMLYIGLREGVAETDLRSTVGTPELPGLLRCVQARPGSLHHLPAGVIHALGAGVLALEVQTPSDTTFRLYDWSREYGRVPRDLHLDEGLEVVEECWRQNTDPELSMHRDASDTGELLATDAYQIRRVDLHASAVWRSPAGVARIVYVEKGRLRGHGLARPLRRGGNVLLPAAWEGDLVAEVASQVIEVVVGGKGTHG